MLSDAPCPCRNTSRKSSISSEKTRWCWWLEQLALGKLPRWVTDERVVEVSAGVHVLCCNDAELSTLITSASVLMSVVTTKVCPRCSDPSVPTGRVPQEPGTLQDFLHPAETPGYHHSRWPGGSRKRRECWQNCRLPHQTGEQVDVFPDEETPHAHAASH